MTAKTGREMAGMAVVTLSGGERLGRIDDVVFEPATGRVTGFMVDRGGMFSKPKFLPVGAVQSLGADAATVAGADTLLDTNPALGAAAELAAKPLEGRPVLSQAGTVLGKVSDVVLDTEARIVTSLLLTTGLLDNALHGRPALPFAHVRTIGVDSVIASNDYDPKNPAT